MSEKHEEDYGGTVKVGINLDSTRPDLKLLLAELNPILQKIIAIVQKEPDETAKPPVACDDKAYHNVNRGYHNIVYTGPK